MAGSGLSIISTGRPPQGSGYYAIKAVHRVERSLDEASELRPLTTAADELADEYLACGRYTEAALESVLTQILSFVPVRPILAVDIGAGTGVPGRILARLSGQISVVAVDISTKMLKALRRGGDAPWLGQVASDAEQLGLRNCSFDLTLSVTAFHLFGDKRRAIAEFSRITKPGGVAAIVIIDPNDLATQIFHRYFPEFRDVDRPRHLSTDSIVTMAKKQELQLIESKRQEFAIIFDNVDELIDFIARRPFFGLRQLSNKKFADGFKRFARNVRRDFPTTEIVSESALTAIIFQRNR